MSYLAECSPVESQKVLAHANAVKAQRAIYRHHRQGYSNDRGRTMRHIASVPVSVVFSKRYRHYFDPQIPYEDRRKMTMAFLRQYEKDTGIDLRVVEKC